MLAVLLTVLLLAWLVVWQPGWLIAALAYQSPEVTYAVEVQEPLVALTIDDGPDPVTTSKILDLLARHRARATFFLITDHIAGNETLVKRMVRDGHEIGNHLTTDAPSIHLSPAEFELELVKAHGKLERFADIRWFRPGSGWYDRNMVSIAEKNNYKTALGSVYPYDPWIPSAWFASRQILANVKPGSIIILHDNGARGERTFAALATILPILGDQGYRVVTLSELAGLAFQDE
jgi:peptidoglycan/xylan/chitin deacetylase (PgdA/CDA1 family)